MAYSRYKTVNFGSSNVGLSTVGYTLLPGGSRITAGVAKVGTSTGIYGATASIPDAFVGAILWDTGEGGATSYAAEEINPGADEYTDAAISTRSTAAAVWAVTTRTTTGGAIDSVITVQGLAAGVITAGSIAADAITSTGLASNAVAEIQAGLATAAALTTIDDFLDTEIAAIKARTDQLTFTTPNVVDASATVSLGATAPAGWINAAALASDAITAAKVAADVLAEVADAVWDEPKAGHVTASTYGVYLDASVSGVSTGGVSAGDIAAAVWADAPAGTPVADIAAAVWDDAPAGTPVADIASAVWGSSTRALTATGLDAIPITAPAGVATTFPAMVVQTWRRFFKKATKNATQIRTYADNGSTVVTTQSCSDDGTTETQGSAS